MPSAKLSALKSAIEITFYELNKFYLEIYIYAYPYIHIMKVNEKGSHEFSGEWGGVYRRIKGRKGKKKWYNDIVTSRNQK